MESKYSNHIKACCYFVRSSYARIRSVMIVANLDFLMQTSRVLIGVLVTPKMDTVTKI